jgi:cholesterol oxidase
MSTHHSCIDQAFDVVVIGSGFGGAAVACRLAQAGKTVAILEQGKEYQPGPVNVLATGHGSSQIRHGHFVVDVGAGMNVIRGVGVGGGSLHYFGVRLRADAEIFDDPRWPRSISRQALDPYYDLAGDMLHAAPLTPNPVLGLPVRSSAFLAAAKNCRRCVGEPHLVPIAVHSTAAPAKTASGIDQTRCVYCGECLVGCPPSQSFEGNVNARALLTLNYLAVARQTGRTQIFPQHRVEQIRQAGKAFEVDVAVLDADDAVVQQGIVRAKQVVLAAGSLGSTEVLLKSQDKGGLTGLSHKLGHYFSGNGDFLIPKTVNTPQNLQPKSGPSITVGADFSNAENKIFIEDLGTIPFVEAVVGMEKNTATQANPYQLGYLGMGTDAANGELRLHNGKVRLYWDPEQSLPLYHQITDCMRELSQQLGGDYQDPKGYNPVTGTGLLTAHPLGGCVMADSPTHGVCNSQGQVYGVPGLFVADGALVPTALATNPSYTISALAERVAFWMLHGREMVAGDRATPTNTNDPAGIPVHPIGTGAPSHPIENALTLNDLAKMSAKELEALYALAKTPRISDMKGPSDGIALAGNADPSAIPFMPWKGKSFKPLNAVEGVGNNRMQKRPHGEEVNEFNFKFTLGDPIDGDDAVIVLDYNNVGNAPQIRIIRDDIKKVNPSLFLGRMYQTTPRGFEFLLYFALQFPASA